MATRKRTGSNGHGVNPGNGTNGRAAARFDPRLVLGQTDQVTASAASIARIADEVWEGAETQIKSLDDAREGVEGIATSLRHTAGQS